MGNEIYANTANTVPYTTHIQIICEDNNSSISSPINFELKPCINPIKL